MSTNFPFGEYFSQVSLKVSLDKASARDDDNRAAAFYLACFGILGTWACLLQVARSNLIMHGSVHYTRVLA